MAPADRPAERAATDDHDRGASPVIGVVLVVGVVAVLAAIVGVNSLGLVSQLQDPTPQARFDFEWQPTTQTLTIVHDGGEPITPSNTGRLEVVVHDEDGTGSNDYDVARADWLNRSMDGATIAVGDSFTVTGESGGGDLDVERDGTDVSNPGSETHEPEPEDHVELFWYGPGGDGVQLIEYRIPGSEV